MKQENFLKALGIVSGILGTIVTGMGEYRKLKELDMKKQGRSRKRKR